MHLVLLCFSTMLIHFWLALRLLVSLGYTSASAPSNSKATVDVGYAKYLGNLSFPNTVAYLGVPYAEPPVGDRRFRAPLPLNTTRISHEAHGNTLNATSYSDFCVQGSTGGNYDPATQYTSQNYNWALFRW